MRASHIYHPGGDPDKVVYVYVISVMGDKSTIRVTSPSRVPGYEVSDVRYVPTEHLELVL
jgi:hypothetical protein